MQREQHRQFVQRMEHFTSQQKQQHLELAERQHQEMVALQVDLEALRLAHEEDINHLVGRQNAAEGAMAVMEAEFHEAGQDHSRSLEEGLQSLWSETDERFKAGWEELKAGQEALRREVLKKIAERLPTQATSTPRGPLNADASPSISRGPSSTTRMSNGSTLAREEVAPNQSSGHRRTMVAQPETPTRPSSRYWRHYMAGVTRRRQPI